MPFFSFVLSFSGICMHSDGAWKDAWFFIIGRYPPGGILGAYGIVHGIVHWIIKAFVLERG